MSRKSSPIYVLIKKVKYIALPYTKRSTNIIYKLDSKTTTMLIKKNSHNFPSGASHSKFRAGEMLAKRREGYAKKTKSAKKKEAKDQRKRKQEREQGAARKSPEPAERGPKSKKPKAEPSKTSHTNEKSDDSSMSED